MRPEQRNRRNVKVSMVGLYHINGIRSPMVVLSELDKETVCIPRERADYLWQVLKNGITHIQHHSQIDTSFEELYKCGYLLAMHKYGAMLYNGLTQTITEYLKYTVQVKVSESFNGQFLKILLSYFRRHISSLAVLRGVLTYLDKVYVPQHDLDNVFTMGLKLFKTMIICDTIQTYMRNTFLDLVRKERTEESQKMDRPLFRSITRMLVDLGTNSPFVYQENFEEVFLEESRNFFSEEGDKLLKTNDVPHYLLHVEKRLSEELERSDQCYDPSTTREIVKVVEDELIGKHVQALVGASTGVVHMMENHRTDDLARTYKLLGRVREGVDTMFSAISQFIREQGLIIISADSNSNPLIYVENLLRLKDKIEFCVGHSLANDKQFRKILNNDFEYILNLNPRSPENIALYIDDKMKKSVKCMSDHGDMLATWDKTMVLFRYIREKDLFQGYYKQLLAGRLLFTKTNEENEKYFISKLKRECGLQFSRCFDGMLIDMERSSNLTEEFRIHPSHSEGPTGGLELSMRVLTPVYWPVHSEPNCTLPRNAQQAFDSFKEFYTTRHTGRKLKLLPQRGTAEILYNLSEDRTYTLVVQTYQMCVLMLFNEKNSWTFQELLSETGVPAQDLQRALNPLITMGKSSQGILEKNPNTRAIEETDCFFIDASFYSKTLRVKIQNQGKTDPGPESDKADIVNLTNEEKVIEVKAAIVRIMKKEKRLNHELLVRYAKTALSPRFFPTSIMIRNQIETLIEMEYIERDDNDRRAYIYIC